MKLDTKFFEDCSRYVKSTCPICDTKLVLYWEDGRYHCECVECGLTTPPRFNKADAWKDIVESNYS